jgi:peptidoglycan glycosyltransferase
VNKQILHVSVASLVLIAALIVSTTYWQTWAVGDLADRQDNAISLVARLTVDRGKFLAPGGTVFATNRRHRKHGLTIFTRHYPVRGLAPQVVGYSTVAGTTTGLESSLDDYLTGANTNLSNTLKQTLDKLSDKTVHGDNVILTLRPSVQALALHELAGRCGAVVALDAKTGAIYAMASSPTYDPNLVSKPGGYAKILKIKGACGDASALVNNATAGLYTPGSTFKLITASAALDTGAVTPTTGFFDPGYCIEYGKKVYNSSSPDSPTAHETFGHVTFSEALQHSINAVFCNVGKQIGAKTILDYAKRYGFYSLPPLDLPPSSSQASGLYKYEHGHYRLWFPNDPATEVDPGRLAFGQERMQTTPLQMALVAATIAHGGIEPKPYLVQKILAPDGSTVTSTRPQTLGRVIKPQTAAELNQMMQLVVQGGTGTNAQIPGVAVAGKTGTAETSIPNVYNAWFVAFAPADNPRYVVAVVVEKQPNGFGGSVSAPIAKAILEKLLHR